MMEDSRIIELYWQRSENAIAETDKKYGARPLRRALQNELEDKLAEAILNGEVKSGEEVVVHISNKELKFN